MLYVRRKEGEPRFAALPRSPVLFLRRPLQVLLLHLEALTDSGIMRRDDRGPGSLFGENRISPAGVDGVVMVATLTEELARLSIADDRSASLSQEFRAIVPDDIGLVGGDVAAARHVGDRLRDGLGRTAACGRSTPSTAEQARQAGQGASAATAAA